MREKNEKGNERKIWRERVEKIGKIENEFSDEEERKKLL